MKEFSLLGAALILAACEAATGGAGVTQRGEPLVGDLHVNHSTQDVTTTVTSPAGWNCVGVFKKKADLGVKSSNIPVPLTCSNGAKGNGIISYNQYTNTATMAFSLANGERGSVRFGN